MKGLDFKDELTHTEVLRLYLSHKNSAMRVGVYTLRGAERRGFKDVHQGD